MTPRPDITPNPAFRQVDHRPWPLPEGDWSMRQRWVNLAFFHWEADPAYLRARIPAGLELDLYDNKAWLGVVPFEMQRVTRRGWPAPALFCDFPEINLRTYVTRDGKPGVWFFSLDVPHRLAVWLARRFYHLPYYRARISVSHVQGRVSYRHRREPPGFDADYWPVRARSFAEGSFERWCSERYCLYAQSRRGALYRGNIHHPPWPLQEAHAEIRRNTFLEGLPVGPMRPSILFSKSIDVVVFPLERLS